MQCPHHLLLYFIHHSINGTAGQWPEAWSHSTMCLVLWISELFWGPSIFIWPTLHVGKKGKCVFVCVCVYTSHRTLWFSRWDLAVPLNWTWWVCEFNRISQYFRFCRSSRSSFNVSGCSPARFNQIHTTEEEKLHAKVIRESQRITQTILSFQAALTD